MLQSHSTPSESDTIYIIRNVTETKSVRKHSCGAHSPQTKRDQCGMGSHTLNRVVWNDLWCVRKRCEYVVIVPASADVCWVLQLQGLWRNQLAVLQRRHSVWSLSVQSCAFNQGDGTLLPEKCCRYRGRSLVVWNRSGFRSSALTARWSDGSERLCSIFGRRSWTCSIATRIWQGKRR